MIHQNSTSYDSHTMNTSYLTCHLPKGAHTATAQTFNSCTSRPDVCQCPVGKMSKNKLGSQMTHVACKSKPCSVMKSSMHPCPGNWAAIRHAVVYYAKAAHAFSAAIKCRHCMLSFFLCIAINIAEAEHTKSLSEPLL